MNTIQIERFSKLHCEQKELNDRQRRLIRKIYQLDDPITVNEIIKELKDINSKNNAINFEINNIIAAMEKGDEKYES